MLPNDVKQIRKVMQSLGSLQVFAAAGVYTMRVPGGYKAVVHHLSGATGGGGGGYCGTGSPSGGANAANVTPVVAGALNTEPGELLTITVGAKGLGGAGSPASGSAASAGTAGTASSIAAATSGWSLSSAGGAGGAAGTSTGGSGTGDGSDGILPYASAIGGRGGNPGVSPGVAYGGTGSDGMDGCVIISLVKEAV